MIEFFRKYGFDIELHPEFDLLNSFGFTPVALLKTSKFFNSQLDYDIVTGCDLSVSEIDDDLLEEIGKEGVVCKKVLTHWITATARHSEFEVLFSSLLSFAIAFIFDGIFSDPQFNGVFVQKRKWCDFLIKRKKDDVLCSYLDYIKQNLKTFLSKDQYEEFKGWEIML